MEPSNELPLVPNQEAVIYVAWRPGMLTSVWAIDKTDLIQYLAGNLKQGSWSKRFQLPPVMKATVSSRRTAGHKWLCFNTSSSTDGKTRSLLVFDTKEQATKALSGYRANNNKQGLKEYQPTYSDPVKYKMENDNGL